MTEVAYTQHEKTWCAGCTNHSLLESSKRAFNDLINESNGTIKKEDFVLCTGIGCHGKMHDYFEMSSIYCLHGRDLATAFGLKVGNPNLQVVVFAGDGDAYDEGMEHFVHAMRYNMDMTLIVHDNQLLSLTTGQPTVTSWVGLKNRTAYGVLEKPFNPVHMAISLGAGFVARANSMDIADTQRIIKEAIKYRGFAFVEVTQPCIFFHDTREFFKKNFYKLDEAEKDNKEKALIKSLEWNYEFKDGKIPYGIFYQKERASFEEGEPQLKALLDGKKTWWEIERNTDVERLLE